MKHNRTASNASTFVNGMGLTPPQTCEPFPREYQLDCSLDDLPDLELLKDGHGSQSSSYSLPDHPSLSLNNTTALSGFLQTDLCAPDLEEMAPYLWMLSTQSSSNVSPLNYQLVKGRNIVVTESPRLHLVWIYDRVFIKPLPAYLLSHTFWTTYLLSQNSPLGAEQEIIKKSALGYLRTYHHLIRHPSDFRIAQRADLQLVPAHVSYETFCLFMSKLASISDDDCSARYHYGELRLTRLNFYCKLILRRRHFQNVHGQYGAYFSSFYGPLLFLFSVMSLILNAMQVEMAVESLQTKWGDFGEFCRWFSVLTMVAIMVVAVAMVTLLLWMIGDEWTFAIRDFRRKRRAREKV